MLRTAVILIIWLAIYTKAFATYYKQYNTSNGLVSNNVYNAYRDRSGFIWFFTDKGVSKFDGKKFKNFTLLDGLGDNEVFRGYQDMQGRLWLFTYNGNMCYIYNDHVYNAANSALLSSMPVISFINDIYEDIDSALYIGFNGGEIIKIKNKQVVWINKGKTKYPIHTISKINGKITAFTAYGKFYINNDNTTRIFPIKENCSYRQNGAVILASNDNIKKYENGTLVFEIQDTILRNKNILYLYVTKSKNLLCCTRDGLIIYNMASKSIITLCQGSQVSSATEDIYGNYWVTTLQNGIYFISKEMDNIKYIGTLNNYIFMSTRSNQFFLRQNDGVYTISGKRNEEIIKVASLFNEKDVPLYANDSQLVYTNSISFPHRSYYLNLINHKSYLFPKFYKYAFPYNNGLLLIGFSGFTDVVFKKNELKTKKDFVLDESRIMFPVFDGYNNLYFIKSKYLYKYNTSKLLLVAIDSFEKFQSIAGVYTFNDMLVLATNDQKIITYSLLNDREKHIFNQKNNFLIIDAYRLVDGRYLLNTDHGYYILKSTTKDISNISDAKKIEYPFRSSDIVFMYPYKGRIICNANGAVYSFDQNMLNIKVDSPKVFINKILANGKLYFNKSIVVNNTTNGNLQLSLGTLYFNNTENYFQYRVISNSTIGQWYSQTANDFNILLGKAGEYKVEIRSITENNIASIPETIILLVTPPFYLTKYFFSIVTILILIIALYVFYTISRKKRTLFENELKYLQLENKAINSIMTPHFVFNAINNIQSLVNSGMKSDANNYLSALSHLIRQNIENLQYDFILIEKELNLVRNYVALQNLRYNNKIGLEILDRTYRSGHIKVPPLLIHTFVENAIVHGFRNEMTDFKITIELDLSMDDRLILCITDNGVGFKYNKNVATSVAGKTSIGIDFNLKRLKRISEYYKKDFTLEINGRENINGTEVMVIVSAEFNKIDTHK